MATTTTTAFVPSLTTATTVAADTTATDAADTDGTAATTNAKRPRTSTSTDGSTTTATFGMMSDTKDDNIHNSSSVNQDDSEDRRKPLRKRRRNDCWSNNSSNNNDPEPSPTGTKSDSVNNQSNTGEKNNKNDEQGELPEQRPSAAKDKKPDATKVGEAAVEEAGSNNDVTPVEGGLEGVSTTTAIEESEQDPAFVVTVSSEPTDVNGTADAASATPELAHETTHDDGKQKAVEGTQPKEDATSVNVASVEREHDDKKSTAAERTADNNLHASGTDSVDGDSKPASISEPGSNEWILEQVTVGCRVSVYWDGEGAYFDGTITQERNHPKRPLYILYDDGDQEWIDLSKETFRLLSVPTTSGLESSELVYSYGGVENAAVNAGDEPSTPDTFPAANTPPSSASPKGRRRARTTRKASRTSKKKTRKAGKATERKPPSSKHPSANNLGASAEQRPPIEDDWVRAGQLPRSPDDSSDSETDEEEIMQWGAKMFGVTLPSPPIAHRKTTTACNGPVAHSPISEAVKLGRRSRRSCTDVCISGRSSTGHEAAVVTRTESTEEEEAKRKKEAARPLSSAEIKSWLSKDLCPAAVSEHWVRRSVRQPSRSALNSSQVKQLLDKLRFNDTDMIVLKLKKYISDPNAPQIVIDATLDALEENTNCEALYIQNFNEGMRDAQVLKLLDVLKRPSCKIWCLNIGETYKVKTKTWKEFADGLSETKVTHMYASEHTITPKLKEQIRSTIRNNRSKHSMHNDPDNLETIVQCTHCWWNPINAKNLRPHLKKLGYEHILHDKEAQGLRGSQSAANGALG